MPANSLHLVAACLAMVLLTFVVSARMLQSRVREMRAKRIDAQAVSTSVAMAQRLADVRAADNFRNIFEISASFALLVGMWLAFWLSMRAAAAAA